MYAHPTIQQLGDYFWTVLTGTAHVQQSNGVDQIEKKGAEMQSLVTKYTTDIPAPAWKTSPTRPTTETVLLTGSTGRLGCHILKQLIDREDVLKVYALNRPNNQGMSTEARQREALNFWGIDTRPGTLEKVVFLDYDMSKDKLGLDDLYDTVSVFLLKITTNAHRCPAPNHSHNHHSQRCDLLIYSTENEAEYML